MEYPATDLGTGEKWPRGKNLHPATDPRTTRKMPLRQNEGIPASDLGTVRKCPEGKSGHLPAPPSALPFIAYQHCPSKQGQERELSISNL